MAYDLIPLPQPYPDSEPWVDLRPYLGPSWDMGGSAFHFRGRLDGNTAHIHLRTRFGTQSVLAEELPAPFHPPGQLVLPAFAPGVSGAVGALLGADGRLTVYAPGVAVLDGTLANLVMQVSYTRKVG